MATTRYQRSSSNPEREYERAGPVNISFPSTADSWVADGASPHTIQFLATRRVEYRQALDSLYKQSNQYIENFLSQFKQSLPEGAQQTWSEWLSTFGGNTKDAFTQLLTQNSDRNLLVERALRIQNSDNRLEGVFTFYMPSPVIFPLDNEYEDMRLTEKIGGVLGATVSTALKVGAGAGALAGYPINPKVEILFRNLNQRKFQFEFKFHPASAAETEQLRLALKNIRMFASPTRMGAEGIIWKAPDTFDIRILHNGMENTQVPKIAECVLETMEVDYTPTATGWTTFTNGHPVTTRVVMNFRELEPIDRANVERGF